MGGAQQPAAIGVKKTVRLVIHLHGDMGAAVQVGVHLALVANGKGPAGLTGKHHVKRHRQATIRQIGRGGG